MKCPVCGSESYQILKSKGKKTRDLLLKCDECKTIYKEIIAETNPVNCRIIISEYGTSKKMYIKLHPDDFLEVDDILHVDGSEVLITSIEIKSGARVGKSHVSDIETIWASSLDLPARVGVSIDFGGRIVSKKVEVNRDFEFKVGDVIKLGRLLFKVYSIKTMKKNKRRGSSKAFLTKRVYGRPLNKDESFNYDLSSKVV
jgi:uncharacterized Zn finger protein